MVERENDYREMLDAIKANTEMLTALYGISKANYDVNKAMYDEMVKSRQNNNNK